MKNYFGRVPRLESTLFRVKKRPDKNNSDIVKDILVRFS